jgi:hypothetical protein
MILEDYHRMHEGTETSGTSGKSPYRDTYFSRHFDDIGSSKRKEMDSAKFESEAPCLVERFDPSFQASHCDRWRA